MGNSHICQCCGMGSRTLAEADTELKDGVLTPKGESEQTTSYPETVVCEHCGAEYCEGNLIKQGNVREG
jgi:hypothetical protein